MWANSNLWLLASKDAVLITAGERTPVMGYWDSGPNTELMKS